ncbi:tyrosyl-DNA phosphodiesterase-domain-containing protein [Lipomyces oligophaga]|uniref:tyrosyl-DNA phosphodiesterase-domain-containing protein n=1 Tax=Lipomyces oligophaga TaxID=45792 RepID=UPI0034CF7E9B
MAFIDLTSSPEGDRMYTAVSDRSSESPIDVGPKVDDAPEIKSDQEKPCRTYLAQLDRTAMERERLLRISRSNGGARPKRGREDDEDDIDKGSAVEFLKSQPLKAPFGSNSRDRSMIDGSEQKRAKEDPLALQYPNGVVKRTLVSGYARTVHDVTIEEVLQPRILQTAVLSAFQWDYKWILDKLFVNRTELVFVIPDKDPDSRKRISNFLTKLPNARVCTPDMSGPINCMHSKLQLLFYKQYLRVVIPTANLTDYDWGEGAGVIENYMYIQDFPLRSVPLDDPPQLPQFATELIYFLHKQNMFSDILSVLLKVVVWENVQNVQFIHSVGGKYSTDRELNRTGHPGLASAVCEFGADGSPVQIDYLVSSLGSLSPSFTLNVYNSAKGKPTPLLAKPEFNEREYEEAKRNFRIYFPTHDTVAQSKGGIDSGGTICLSTKYWQKSEFPREIIRDARSTRQKCLMHEKVMFIRFENEKTSSDGTKIAGLVYVGSANMSQSAWGLMTTSRSPKHASLTIRNWECGVLIRAVSGRQTGSEFDMKTVPETFAGILPIPMEIVNTQYNGKQPWFFMGKKEW